MNSRYVVVVLGVSRLGSIKAPVIHNTEWGDRKVY